MLKSPFDVYQRTRAETANPGELVVLLYDGAITATSLAWAHLEHRRLDQAHTSLIRAQAILSELRGSLNHQAGDLARRLDALYGYALERLVEANVKKSPDPAREALGLLKELLPAWQHAAQVVACGARTEPAARLAVVEVG